ncbi:basic proline-rich protein-like [Strigops habroptila]|uniref:basic proline-rich protein-like n=1 Tax=Strigops habroptila TaxID=2489341 RepID=UPI0011CF21E0|nr:basic proline-rich protein-like [Strigops habroptila]
MGTLGHLVCAECPRSQLAGVAVRPEPHGVPPSLRRLRWDAQELFSALGAWHGDGDVSKSGAPVHVHQDGTGGSWVPSPGDAATTTPQGAGVSTNEREGPRFLELLPPERRRSQPCPDRGCQTETPRRTPPPGAGPQRHVRALRGHTEPRWEGECALPPPCAKTPGQRSPPNRFHRGLPKPHGGPGPLPIAPPVPAGVRRGEAQLWPPSLPVPAPLLGVMVAAAAEARERPGPPPESPPRDEATTSPRPGPAAARPRTRHRRATPRAGPTGPRHAARHATATQPTRGPRGETTALRAGGKPGEPRGGAAAGGKAPVRGGARFGPYLGGGSGGRGAERIGAQRRRRRRTAPGSSPGPAAPPARPLRRGRSPLRRPQPLPAPAAPAPRRAPSGDPSRGGKRGGSGGATGGAVMGTVPAAERRTLGPPSPRQAAAGQEQQKVGGPPSLGPRLVRHRHWGVPAVPVTPWEGEAPPPAGLLLALIAGKGPGPFRPPLGQPLVGTPNAFACPLLAHSRICTPICTLTPLHELLAHPSHSPLASILQTTSPSIPRAPPPNQRPAFWRVPTWRCPGAEERAGRPPRCRVLVRAGRGRGGAGGSPGDGPAALRGLTRPQPRPPRTPPEPPFPTHGRALPPTPPPAPRRFPDGVSRSFPPA